MARFRLTFGIGLAWVALATQALAQFPDEYKFGDSDSFTISYWYNTGFVQSTDTAMVSNKNWASGGNRGYVMTLNNSGAENRWKVNGNTDLNARFDSTWTNQSLDTWHFVAMTVDQLAGTVTAYVNGLGETLTPAALGSFETWSATPGSGLDFNIGQDGTGSYEGGQSYKGLIDDVAIWDRALSVSELDYLRTQGSAGSDLGALFGTSAGGGAPVINSGLVGYYRFENNAHDTAGNAEISDGVWRAGAGGATDTYAASKSGFGQAANLDGLAYITIGNSPDLPPPVNANWTGADPGNNFASDPDNWTSNPASWSSGTVVTIVGNTSPGDPLLVRPGDSLEFGNVQIGDPSGDPASTNYFSMTGGNFIGRGSNDSVIGNANSSVVLNLSGNSVFNHLGDGEEASELRIARNQGSAVTINLSGSSQLSAGEYAVTASTATGTTREGTSRLGDDISFGGGGHLTVTMNDNSQIYVNDVLYPNDATTGTVNVVQNGNSKVLVGWDTRFFDTSGHTEASVINWTLNGNSEFRVQRDHGLGEQAGTGTININVNDNAQFVAGDRIGIGADGGGNVTVNISGGLMKVGGNSASDVILVDETGGGTPRAVDWYLHVGGGAQNAVLNQSGGAVEVGRSVYLGRGGGKGTINVSGGAFTVLGEGPDAIGLGNGFGGGAPSGIDWVAEGDLGGGDIYIGFSSGDDGTFNFSGGTVDVARDIVVGLDGAGKLNLIGPSSGGSGSLSVHGALTFGGLDTPFAGTGTLQATVAATPIIPVVVDGTNDEFGYGGDVIIHPGSEFTLSFKAGDRPAPGANAGIQTMVNYAGTRTGTFSEVDVVNEVGIDYSLVYDNVGKRIRVNLDFVYPQGDANLDGAVTGADFTIWADKFGSGTLWTEGDFNNDGAVTGADFTLWADNFGTNVGPPPATSVPEPSAMVLAMAALGALVAVGRLGRRK